MYDENFKDTLAKVRNALTPEQIIKLVTSLGVDRYYENDDYIIFPTICHNVNIAEASMKLYYYKNTKLFHCYTECDESFSIYDLFRKYYELHYIEYNFINDIYAKILSYSDISIFSSFESVGYISQKDKFLPKERQELTPFSPVILELFASVPVREWLNEGISQKSLKKYNILFSISQNKIIIPHYDINGNLVGIRGRALNPWEAATYGKYMPMKIEKQWYSHPLSLNLYGINFAKDNIIKNKKCILFEGEKSVLLYDTYFDENISVAVCGSSFNKKQLDLLLPLGVNEIIIAFDKEFESSHDDDDKRYFKKMVSLCQKYNKYCTFSFIYDQDNLLDHKDSPIDKGKEVFLTLLNNRIEVRHEI